MNDTRTQAEKDTGQAVLDAFKKRIEGEQKAGKPNPLQQPLPRYGQAIEPVRDAGK